MSTFVVIGAKRTEALFVFVWVHLLLGGGWAREVGGSSWGREGSHIYLSSCDFAYCVKLRLFTITEHKSIVLGYTLKKVEF